jgi:hypothetical protein
MMPRFLMPRFLLPRFPGAALAVLGATLVLSGCNDRIVVCPGIAVLADAAARPVLKPGSAGIDPSSLLYRVEITGISQRCNLDIRDGQSSSNIRISFHATRAPSGQAARYTVPYFVAVNQAERIIVKRGFNASVDFPAGAAAVTFETVVNSAVLKFENGRLPGDYQFLAGLEVSDAERAYLQAMARVTP